MTGFIDWLGQTHPDARKAERTRTALLQSGAGLLRSTPPDRLTVAAICKQAGVAHGTFYRYFADRNVLVGEVLRALADYLQADMRAAARAGGDAIRNTTAAYMRHFEENAGLMNCLIVGGDAVPQARRVFQELNREWIVTVVRATQRDAGAAARPEADLMRRAYALGGMVDQYLTALFLTRDPWIADLSQDREAVLEMLTDLWRKGMAP
ncbi:MAG: TetR/AcrR family transcriptional regulator [Natronohydrobacter sp.]|nr:TetR/AcrR family transcriptional regulator [Natronohydrobacter sp.]